jgi:hypothetical protein
VAISVSENVEMQPGWLRRIWRKQQNGGDMARRLVWSAVLLALAVVGGCQTIAERSLGARTLTEPEMDAITAGSAVAGNDSAALGIGSETHTAALGSTSAYSGVSPILGIPFLNYEKSEASASASGDELAQTTLSSDVYVDGANGGASITTTAAGIGTRRAQAIAQFNGISTNRADLVFGSVTAVACCGSASAARVNLDSSTGGPYSKELRAMPASKVSGQAESRVDITVVSSALPILDQAEVLVARTSTRISPKY